MANEHTYKVKSPKGTLTHVRYADTERDTDDTAMRNTKRRVQAEKAREQWLHTYDPTLVLTIEECDTRGNPI